MKATVVSEIALFEFSLLSTSVLLALPFTSVCRLEIAVSSSVNLSSKTLPLPSYTALVCDIGYTFSLFCVKYFALAIKFLLSNFQYHLSRKQRVLLCSLIPTATIV